MGTHHHFLFLSFWMIATINLTFQISLEEDLTITIPQKQILDQFRNEVKPLLPHEYMSSDLYLVRWLRASNFDTRRAKQRLIENLEWRKQDRMDEVIYENWFDLESMLPYYLEGCDREARPVASVYIGEWEVRKSVITGHGDKLVRYAYKLLEEINTLVREGQKRGRNITQYSILLDLKNLNMPDLACSSCLPLYFTIMTGYEDKYPGSIHKVYIVNAPQVYVEFLNLFRPSMSPALRKTLQIFGSNKKLWQKYLHNDIDPEQLTTDFGGTKEFPTTPFDLRTYQEYPC